MKPSLRSTLAVFAAMVGILLVLVALLMPVIVLVGGKSRELSAMLPASSVFVLGLLVGYRLIRFAGRSLRYSGVVLVGLGMGLIAGVAILGWLQHLGAFERSKVTLADGVLLIQGKLDDELLTSFRRVLKSNALHDVRVRLRSPGGNIYVGMAIGREIYRRHLDVEVDRRCISSCANYLFTAGRNKYVKSVDQVQFHGGALQPNFIPTALELLEQGKQTKSGEDVPDPQHLRELYGLADDFPFNGATSILAEKAFFDEIGVSSLTPVYGQYGDYSAWFNDGVHDNFSYLPEDYALLGVTNVFVTGSKSGGNFGRRLFRAKTSTAAINALQAEMAALYGKIQAAVPFGASTIWRSPISSP